MCYQTTKIHGYNKSDAYQVYIYESEFKLIIAEAQQYPNKETGGSLFGSYTHGGMFVIWLALGPGQKASGSGGEFQQDPSFITQCQQYLMDKYALQYIGGWHSHHRLGLKEPSRGDVDAIQQYTGRHQRYAALEIIVTHDSHNNLDFQTVPRAYFFPDAQQGKYVEAKIIFLSGESPVREKLNHDKKYFYPIEKNINWRQFNAHFQYTSNQNLVQNNVNNQMSSPISKSVRTTGKQINRGGFDHTLELVPDVLQSEIQYLAKDSSVENLNIQIDARDNNHFIVIVSVNDSFRLAIALEVKKQKISILLVNIIDDRPGVNQYNITSDSDNIIKKY